MTDQMTYTTFAGNVRIAAGDLRTMLLETKRYLLEGSDERLLTFEDDTGRQVDFDFTGTPDEVVARALPPGKKRGPGRPRLGVVNVQVSLFPRHWEWLEGQKAGISGTLRRLVEDARKNEPESGRRKRSLEAAGTFMSSMAGDLPGFEEASRALYAMDWGQLGQVTTGWPTDVRNHLFALAGPAGCPAADCLPVSRAQRRKPGEAPSSTNLWEMTATELARVVARGDASALEVLDSQLARIWRVNHRVNAITEVLADEAREAAREVDQHRKAGKPLGPLAGVPFTVKANIDIRGHATTHGIHALSEAMASGDAPIVERLRRAGAIPIAHTNLPDLSLRFHTRSQLYGATVNPWDSTSSPGGSSGGEGVTLAMRMSPLGLGNDAGGSVRIPALFGGVLALKPSTGRFPANLGIGARNPTLASQWIPVDGVLARSVSDLEESFRLLAGTDAKDPRTVPAPLVGPPISGPMRVALFSNPGRGRIHADVSAALQQAAKALSDAGYIIEEQDTPRFQETLDAYGRLIMTEFQQIWPDLERLLGADGHRYIELAMSEHRSATLPEYIALTALHHELQREWALFLERFPLLLGPVFTEPAVPVDFDIQSIESHRMVAAAMGLCSATSFLGLPAIAVPTGVAHGLPQGVQVIGGWFREDLCFAAAAEIESRVGTLMPPLQP